MVCLLAALLAAGPIIITEVMPNPTGSSGAHQPEDRNEFVELHNPGNEAIDLHDWTIDDGDAVDWLVAWQDSSVLTRSPGVLINSTWLLPGGYAVVLDSEYTDPNPKGGFEQPYRFGDSTLLLTTRNTTIGNGLAINDPLVLASPYGDTSTFGTPDNTDDSIPGNPGDGFSWERIDPARPDTIDNWTVCLDSAGSTPGSPNSITTRPNLAINLVACEDPENLEPGVSFTALAGLTNAGFLATADWDIEIFLDLNHNGMPDASDDLKRIAGWLLPPGADSTVRVPLTCPHTQTDLWARIDCPGDLDTTDNRGRISLNPSGKDRILGFGTGSFSPDGDGFEDSLVVVYRLPEPDGTLKIVVFDLSGSCINSLCDIRPDLTEGTVYWDGSTDAGIRAAVGIYAVWLEYRTPDATYTEKLPVALLRQ